MKNKFSALCLAVALATSAMATAQVDGNGGQQSSQPSNGKFLEAALISGIATAVTGGVGGGLASLIGSLFNKLGTEIFGVQPTQTGFNQPQFGYQQPYGNQQQVNNTQQFNTVAPNTAQPPATPGQTSPQYVQVHNNVVATPVGTITPAIAYKIEQLDPATYQPIRTFEDLKNNTPSLNSGDVFSITYEPNMPGQVRLENVDAQNVTSSLGTYNVVGRQPLRIPKTKGFQLSGVPGTEQINIYFTPCRPPEVQTKTGVVEFGALPLCSNSQATNLARAGKGGTIKPKTVINLDSPDINIAVGITTDYTQEDLKNGMPVKQEIKLMHQAVGNRL